MEDQPQESKKSPQQLLNEMPDVLPEETGEAPDAQAAGDEPAEDGKVDAVADGGEVGPEDGSQTAEQQAEEFIETEILGLRGKVSKSLADSLRGILEREYSQAQEVKGMSSKELEEATKSKREAAELREAIQAHLDANPEFHASWKKAQAKRNETSEIESLKKRLDEFTQSQERERQSRSIEQQVAALSSKFKLPENKVYSETDVRERAALNLDRGMNLEAAYSEAVTHYKDRLNKAGLSYVRSKVDAKRALPPAQARRAQGNIKPPERKSPRQQLQEHLRMDEKELQRIGR